MGKELVDFYTQPHNGMLFIYPVEYRFVNVYSFPVSCVLSFSGELQGRLCYFGYEQRLAVITGDLLWFENLKNVLNTLIDDRFQASKNLISQSDEAMLQFKKIKRALIPKGMKPIFRDWIKRSINMKNQLKLSNEFDRKLIVYPNLINGEPILELDLLDSYIITSKDKLTSLDKENYQLEDIIRNLELMNIENYQLEDIIRNLELMNIENYQADNVIRDTKSMNTLIPFTNMRLLKDFRDQLIQLKTNWKPLSLLDANIKMPGNKDIQMSLSSMLNPQNTTRALYLLTEDLIKSDVIKEIILPNDLYKLDKNNTLSELNIKITEKAEQSIRRSYIQQNLEDYIRELIKIQQINGILDLDVNLKQLVFNKSVEISKPKREFVTSEPLNKLSRDPEEATIIYDIISLESVSTLAKMIVNRYRAYKNSRRSIKNYKYYASRKAYKVFKQYFKQIQTTKSKSTVRQQYRLLNILLKYRDTFIHDMDYGLLRTERIPSESIISLKHFLTDSLGKQSIKDIFKVKFGERFKSSEKISVSLEAVHNNKNLYNMYVVLKSDLGEKLYFDFDYSQLTFESAEKIVAIYNEMVYTSKGYTETYNSIMKQFKKTEDEIDSVFKIEHTDKIGISDIIGKWLKLESSKNSILNTDLEELEKLSKNSILNTDLEELERLLKDALLVDKFVLNELYHRWYFLPADGPYDEMILPQDYPYAEKPVNGINEHPFPQGADKATREIPVDIDILTNVIDFCFNLWEANMFLYGGFTPQQALKHFVNLIYEWLANYVPTKIDKIPEYYPTDYEIYDNTDTDREDYWRLYRWIRWYSEALIMNVPSEDEIKLKGNTYIKNLLDDLIKYFEDHHGIFGPPGEKVIDKIKGLRHKWLDKYNKIN